MTATIKNVHPLAELFPMLGKTELAALAADIKANGLREPIKVTEDGTLVEGRNRLEACKLAKVKPHFETVNGDAGNLILSANIFRRHMTKAQIAILAVVAETGVELPENDLSSKDDDDRVLQGQKRYDYQRQAHKRVEGLVSANVIKQAADVIRWAPDYARIVLDSGQDWNEARRVAEERSKTAHSEETRRQILAEDSPDLLALVSDDGISIAEAWKTREDRRKQERDKRNRLTEYLVDRVTRLLDKSNTAELVENYDPELARRSIGIAELDEAISYLQALRLEMKRQKKG